MLRRYLAPQREAITRLQVEKIHWFTERDKRHLYETANSLIRIVEDLDSLRERANVAQEELVNILSEQINSRMYTLSLVTTIFLPLSFLTGLLGINVAGIPGPTNPWAFLIVVAMLLLSASASFSISVKNTGSEPVTSHSAGECTRKNLQASEENWAMRFARSLSRPF